MTVSDLMPAALVVLLAIMFFAGVSALVSRAGGWYALSKQYPRPPEERVRRWWLASGKVGRAYYRGCLIVGVGVDGVFLSCLPPFNIGAPPLYIPWRALRFVGRSKFLWVPALHLQTEDGTPVDVFGIAANLVDRAGPWPP